jgi:NADP-dependent 3-hydroxy acid dehydrogenase YdfG
VTVTPHSPPGTSPYPHVRRLEDVRVPGVQHQHLLPVVVVVAVHRAAAPHRVDAQRHLRGRPPQPYGQGDRLPPPVRGQRPPAAPSAASRIAVVTGASGGIGAATARQLASAGYRVVLTARRKDRIEALAEEINAAGGQATAYALDITDRAAVDEFATAFKTIGVLINNAGGALGADPVATGDPADWRTMYETNVLGTLNITQALLPALTASGDGTVVVVSSTAGHGTYEGGAGYVAAKHGAHVLAETLRLEIVGTPVRVIEVAPGMVKTDEFALTRFGGDAEKAAKVYAGVAEPLTADDVADTITWAVTRPSHVNIDLLVVRPRAQASNTKVHREL